MSVAGTTAHPVGSLTRATAAEQAALLAAGWLDDALVRRGLG